MTSMRLLLFLCILAISGSASAQDAQDVKALAALDARLLAPCPLQDVKQNLTPRGAVDAAAQTTCVGWLASPGGTGKGLGIVTETASGANPNALVGPGIGAVANDLFSAIAAIAVERARRQGLALVSEALADGVCSLSFVIPPADQKVVFRLTDTCTLVRTTDLVALVGQGRALRTALSSDVLSAADLLVVNHLKAFPPLARSASAAVMLAKRMASDPQGNLTKNDVWLIADAFLNGSWPTLTGTQQQTLTTLQISLASARVYLEALKNVQPGDEVDLAYAIRKVTDTACTQAMTTGPECIYLQPAATKLIIDWTGLAVKAASARSADNKSDDLKTRFRSSVQLVFRAYRALTAETEGEPTTLGTRSFTFPAWAETVTTATIDGDAPRLIATIAQLASDAVERRECSGQCAQRQKVAALLTGISTFALSYEEIPANASAETKAALLKAQQEAREAAVNAVIDKATDRRGRDGQWVWSLGTAVGATIFGSQHLDLTSQSGGGSVAETFAANLQVPLGVAVQKLPAGKWAPSGWGFHSMFTALDLGNYVTKTQEAGSSPDWQAIFAPGAQLGLALGKPNNFFALGLWAEYIPRFTSQTSNGTGTALRSASRFGFFASYYVPLWDF